MPKTESEKIICPQLYRVLGADLSLKRPGFALLTIDKTGDKMKLTVDRISSVDNKNDRKKSHGELLSDIRIAFLHAAFPSYINTFFIRETEIMHMKTPAERNLSKVVGLLDWQLWNLYKKEWYSIYPVTIKKLITGSGKAEKEEVAQALEAYVGKQDYKCDDESDAVAVAIAWLIQQGELKENL